MKTLIRLHGCYHHFVQCQKKYEKLIVDADQTSQMCRLKWVFTDLTTSASGMLLFHMYILHVLPHLLQTGNEVLSYHVTINIKLESIHNTNTIFHVTYSQSPSLVPLYSNCSDYPLARLDVTWVRTHQPYQTPPLLLLSDYCSPTVAWPLKFFFKFWLKFLFYLYLLLQLGIGL